jgi:hypothetical protein
MKKCSDPCSKGGAMSVQFNADRRGEAVSAHFNAQFYSAYQQPNPLRPVKGVRALFPERALPGYAVIRKKWSDPGSGKLSDPG